MKIGWDFTFLFFNITNAFLNLNNMKNKPTQKILTLIFGFLFSNSTINAQTIFSGNADFYYRFDFANTENALYNNNFTSFTNSNDSFELGMATLKATHKIGKVSVVADLGFGNRVKEYNYNDNSNEFMIKQLNITYEFSEKFKITAGAFATHLGYELVDATDNKNYSMSYAFTNGPFFNTGIKAQYTSGKFSIMAGVSNPTDFKSASEAGTKQKTFLSQVGYTANSGSLLLNFTTGSNNPKLVNNQQIDLVATKKISEKLNLVLNGTYATVTEDFILGQKNWFSAVGYVQYSLTKKSSLAYRFEYFDDKNKLRYNAENLNIISNTLSMNFKEGNFTFIPEIRFENASDAIFTKNKDLDVSKTAASILIATTYSF
jgi:Putative beta-barrel porin-2, OmpL-like. bbp2